VSGREHGDPTFAARQRSPQRVPDTLEFHITVEALFVEELAGAVAAAVGDRLTLPRRGDRWLYGAAAAAEYLGWPKARIHRKLKALPHRRHDGALVFRTDELDAYLDSLYDGPKDLDPGLRHRSTGVPRLRRPA
jgi:hypothetical protein